MSPPDGLSRGVTQLMLIVDERPLAWRPIRGGRARRQTGGMRSMRVGALVGLAVAAASVWAVSPASGAVNLCVPSAAGAAVTSGGSGGGCPSGASKVALPSSSADQQTLLSVLP